MSVSRRKFIKAGVIATVCAGLPLKSVLAQTDTASQSSPSSISLEQLSYYTKSTFDSYVNTSFRVYLSPTDTRSLELTKVNDHLIFLSRQARVSVQSGEECFSLFFTLPPGSSFTQDTYLITHAALGTFYMFVVPVGAYGKTSPAFYEAIIDRRKQPSGSLETFNLTGDKPTVARVPTIARVPTQAELNSQPAYGGMPLIFVPGKEDTKIILPDRQQTKEEQDVYRFRQVETESPAIAEQMNSERAKKKGTYPLTMAQFTAINGLRLGMTSEQVLALFPGSKTDKEVRAELSRPASRFGVSSFKIKPAKYSSKSKFDDISQIMFTLLDDRVSTLYLGYDGPVWENVDEFVTNFSEQRRLPAPADYWEPYVGMDDQLKTLKCQDFEIRLFAGGQNLNINYVQVRDLVAAQKHKERRAKAKKDSTKS